MQKMVLIINTLSVRYPYLFYSIFHPDFNPHINSQKSYKSTHCRIFMCIFYCTSLCKLLKNIKLNNSDVNVSYWIEKGKNFPGFLLQLSIQAKSNLPNWV